MSVDNSYQLDKDDIIIAVSPNWDEMALENGAPDAISNHVIGKKLWTYIDGFETQLYLNSIFFACRMDMQPFEILYRCDAPETKILYRLSVKPELDEGLTLNHNIVHTKQKLDGQRVTAFSDHYDQTRCSICCSFLIGENWIDTFGSPENRYFAKSYGICPKCQAKARLALLNRTENVTDFSPIVSGNGARNP